MQAPPRPPESGAAHGPPAHWLARVRSGPPAHWLEDIRRRAANPERLETFDVTVQTPEPERASTQDVHAGIFPEPRDTAVPCAPSQDSKGKRGRRPIPMRLSGPQAGSASAKTSTPDAGAPGLPAPETKPRSMLSSIVESVFGVRLHPRDDTARAVSGAPAVSTAASAPYPPETPLLAGGGSPDVTPASRMLHQAPASTTQTTMDNGMPKALDEVPASGVMPASGVPISQTPDEAPAFRPPVSTAARRPGRVAQPIVGVRRGQFPHRQTAHETVAPAVQADATPRPPVRQTSDNRPVPRVHFPQPRFEVERPQVLPGWSESVTSSPAGIDEARRAAPNSWPELPPDNWPAADDDAVAQRERDHLQVLRREQEGAR